MFKRIGTSFRRSKQKAVTFCVRGLSSALLLAAISAPALAQESGWYGGLGIGQSEFKEGCGIVAVACDDKDTAWSIFGGYQFNANLGAELGYTDLGDATAAGASLGAKGFELTGVGTVPLNQQFALYGKLGFYRWDVDATRPGASFSETGTDPTFGAGVKFNLTRTFALRAQWQRYQDLGDSATTGTSDADVIGVSGVLKF